MALGANPRFVVTSLNDPSPQALYRDLYCARGQDENFIKAVKNDLASDRTSDHAFLANHLRLFYAWPAPPMACSTAYVRTRCAIPNWPVRSRCRSSSNCSSWPCGSCNTRTGSSCTCRAPVRSRACCSASANCFTPLNRHRCAADTKHQVINRNDLIWPRLEALIRLDSAIQGAPRHSCEPWSWFFMCKASTPSSPHPFWPPSARAKTAACSKFEQAAVFMKHSG